MSDRPAAPPELRSLLTELFGVERELAQQGSSLAQQGAGDASAWLMLVEQAAARLRRSAQLLEEAIEPRSSDADGNALAKQAPTGLSDAEKTTLDALFAGEGQQPNEPDDPARTRKAPGSEGVITGHAQVIPISELLGFLSGLRKSGMLWVDTPRESFLLQLQEGAVVYAHGDNPPQGQLLGEILVRNSALPREKLAWALVESAAGKDVLGGHLVRKGLIQAEDLTRALAEQAQMIFDRLFGSNDASYQFELGGRLMDSADVRLNVIQLLLESARANDECRLRVEMGAGVPLAKAT
jgi:Domain of unknown function (DUF4388)